MTQQDYFELAQQVKIDFANGQKPTYDQWVNYVKSFTCGLWEPLDTSTAQQALAYAGISKGTIISNEHLRLIFEQLYGHVEYLQQFYTLLDDVGFKNGDKPTEQSFYTLAEPNVQSSTISFKVIAASQHISGYQSGLSLIGANIKIFQDTSTIATASRDGEKLTISGSNYEYRNWIDIQTSVPLLCSYTINLVTYGCEWTSGIKYMQIYDSTNMEILGRTQVLRNNSTSITATFNQAIKLMHAYNNQLLFMVTN